MNPTTGRPAASQHSRPAAAATPPHDPPPAPTPPSAATPEAGASGWREFIPDALAFLGALLCAGLAALLLAVLGGCGGGVGSEGTGSYSSYSSGPITGYGSIIVNGVHYDETTASSIVDDDGVALSADQLALGMVVQIQAGAVSTDSSGRQSASTSSVRASRGLLGPVSAVDTVLQRLTVLDQTVQVQDDTVFSDELANRLSSVAQRLAAAGSTPLVLEIYGSYDSANSRWLATRVALAGADKAASYSLRGTVTAISADGSSFEMCGQTYSMDSLSDTSAVRVGAVLTVALATSTDDDNRWVARGQRNENRHEGQGEHIQLQGLLEQRLSATQLRVDGVVVDIGSSTTVQGTLALGARLQISGTLLNGRLQADTITVQAATSVRSYQLEGQLISVDTALQRLTLRVEHSNRQTVVDWSRTDIVWGSGLSAATLPSYSGRLSIRAQLSTSSNLLQATQVDMDR